MIKSYKIEINPTDEQKNKIHQNIGNCRFVYNLYISHNKHVYESEKRFVSGFDFSKYLNNEFIPNNTEYSWIKKASSKAIKHSIMNAEKAFKNFFKNNAKFPRYKKKTDDVKIYLPKNGETGFKIERHRVKVPILGFVRLKEKGYLKLDSNIINCYISKRVDRYFISFTVKENNNESVNYVKTDEGIGIDLGLKDFAITNDGRKFKNINKTTKIKRLEKSLKREQQKLSRKFEAKKKTRKNKKEEASNNIDKNVLRVQKLHMRLQNKRNGYVQYVVNSLVSVNNLPSFVTIEDLNVTAMMKNRHYSKAISKQNFYKFRQLLIQRCLKFGVEVRIVDRYYPSSKLCSNCGQVKTKHELKISDRIYKCDCGYVEDRDINAGINLKQAKTYKIAT